MFKKIARKKVNQASSTWLEQVKNSVKKSSGSFLAKDKFDVPVVIEWQKTDIMSPDLSEFKKNVCEIAAAEIAPVEVKFLNKYPEAVSEGMFSRACVSFFENGPENVDWQKVEETIKSTFKKFYLTDISSFDEALIKPLMNDVYFNIMLKDKKGTVLGFAMFSITPALADGNIKLIHLAVSQENKNRGLEKLLMGSIFKIVPGVKRIFTGTRPTNKESIEMYRSWGFEKDLNPVQDPKHKFNPEHFIVLEYKTQNTDTLQKMAEGYELR